MLWHGNLWDSRRTIIWRRIRLIAGLLIIFGPILPNCIYFKMSHFNKKEQLWSEPFIKYGSTSFISSNGDTLKARMESRIRNRPAWLRIHLPSISTTDTEYTAHMFTEYYFPSWDTQEIIHLTKPLSNDSVLIYFGYTHSYVELWADTLKLITVELKNKEIPESFYINYTIPEMDSVIRQQNSYWMIHKQLWSKPLGLVYFKTADSTEYYRSDVFHDIPIDKSSPH